MAQQQRTPSTGQGGDLAAASDALILPTDGSVMTDRRLCTEAIKARDNAYAPYSGFRVGAALLTASGRIYRGVNIENASYSPTVCAERVAFFKAFSEGEREFLRIAVAGGRGDLPQNACPPCGVCRQVMAEFCPPDFPVLVVTGPDTFDRYTLAELLPHAFSDPLSGAIPPKL